MASREPSAATTAPPAAAAHCVVGGVDSAVNSTAAGLLVGSRPALRRAPVRPHDGESDAECDSARGYSDSEVDCGKCFENRGRLECPQSQNRHTKLHGICSQGSLVDLRSYTESGLPMHGGDLNGCTPLHVACWRGLLVFVQLLVQFFDVYQCDSDRWTALHYACDSTTGDVELVRYLVEDHGCEICARTNRHNTPLMLAVNNGHLSIVKYLTNRMGSTLDTSSIVEHLWFQGATLPLLRGRIANGEGDESLQSLVFDKPTKEKDMSSYETRLSTFYNGPLHWVRTEPAAEYLASIGFYFTGYEERVVCYSCDSLISSWSDKADPLIQHYLKDPLCAFLKDRFEVTIKRLLSKYKTPKYASSSARLHSFTTWQYSGHVPSYQLASVGFFYTGSGQRVECFSCGLVCDNLKQGEVPLLVHQKRSPLCPFLRSVLDKEPSPPLQPASFHEAASSPCYDPSPQYDPTPSPSSSSSSSALRYDSYSSSQGTVYHPSTVYQQHQPPLAPRSRYHDVSQYPAPHPRPVSHQQTSQFTSSSLLNSADWKDESIRLQSFKMLPVNFPVSKEDCAKAGLYFLRPPDVMKCFNCLCIVKDWIPGDIPAEKHRGVYPECDFIREHFPCKLDQAEDAGFDPSSLPAPVYDAASMEKLHQEYTQKAEARGGASSYSPQQMQDISSQFAGLSTSEREATESFPSSSQRYYQMQAQHYQQRPTASHHLRPTNSVQSSGYGSFYEEVRPSSPPHFHPSSPTPVFSSSSSFYSLPYHSSGRPITLPPSLSPRQHPTSPPQSASHSLPQGVYTRIVPSSPHTTSYQYGPTPYPYQQAPPPPPVMDSYYRVQPYSPVSHSSVPYVDPIVPPPVDTTENNKQQQQQQQQPQSTPSSEDSKLCVVCLDDPAEMACIPCGHMCLCASCAPQIAQCPICRRNITNTIRVFLP